MNRIEQYFINPSVNYSLLKNIDNPPLVKAVIDRDLKEDEEKAHFRIGSAVDTLLTNKTEFNSLFFVEGMGRPGGITGIFIDNLPLGLTEESPLDDFVDAYRTAGYNISIERAVNTLWNNEKYREYYVTRNRAESKSILSTREYDITLACQMSILNNPFARKYFAPEERHLESFTQVPIYFELEGVKLKGLLDGVLIDHIKKTITPFDLKTTAKSVLEFPSTFINLKYYGQAALYFAGLKEVISKGNFFPKEGDYDYQFKLSNYTLENFLFIVCEKAPIQRNPVSWIFRCTDEDLYAGYNGGHTHNKSIKGVRQMIEDFKWHRDNNYWTTPKQALESEGILDLNMLSRS